MIQKTLPKNWFDEDWNPRFFGPRSLKNIIQSRLGVPAIPAPELVIAMTIRDWAKSATMSFLDGFRSMVQIVILLRELKKTDLILDLYGFFSYDHELTSSYDLSLAIRRMMPDADLNIHQSEQLLNAFEDKCYYNHEGHRSGSVNTFADGARLALILFDLLVCYLNKFYEDETDLWERWFFDYISSCLTASGLNYDIHL